MSDFNPILLRKICNTLFFLGVPTHVSGYNYLVSAISLVVSDPSYLRGVTKRLYPTIANEYQVEKAGSVERSIRNAIEIGFNRGNIDHLNEYFGSTIDHKKGKATNSEFISTVSLKIRIALDLEAEKQKDDNK